jgi:hypothetical protein
MERESHTKKDYPQNTRTQEFGVSGRIDTLLGYNVTILIMKYYSFLVSMDMIVRFLNFV